MILCAKRVTVRETTSEHRMDLVNDSDRTWDSIGRKKGEVDAATPPESSATGLTYGLCFWLGLRFGLLTAFLRKLGHDGLLQLFDIHAIALGGIGE